MPQLERKILTLRDHLEHDLGEKDALLKLIISGIQNLNDNLDGRNPMFIRRFFDWYPMNYENMNKFKLIKYISTVAIRKMFKS